MLSNGSAVTDHSGDRRAVFDADHMSGMDEFFRGGVTSRLREHNVQALRGERRSDIASSVPPEVPDQAGQVQ